MPVHTISILQFVILMLVFVFLCVCVCVLVVLVISLYCKTLCTCVSGNKEFCILYLVCFLWMVIGAGIGETRLQ